MFSEDIVDSKGINATFLVRNLIPSVPCYALNGGNMFLFASI